MGQPQRAFIGRVAKARSCSDEERKGRKQLQLLYQQHGLSDWLLETSIRRNSII
jgi:hypothetical protein